MFYLYLYVSVYVATAQGRPATVKWRRLSLSSGCELGFARSRPGHSGQPWSQAPKLCVSLLHASACHLHPTSSYGTYLLNLSLFYSIFLSFILILPIVKKSPFHYDITWPKMKSIFAWIYILYFFCWNSELNPLLHLF